MKKLFLLLIFLVGCAGSPKITVYKNQTNNITIKGEPCPIEQCGRIWPIWIDINNTNKSDLDTKLDIDQDIKPETTIPFMGKSEF